MFETFNPTPQELDERERMEQALQEFALLGQEDAAGEPPADPNAPLVDEPREDNILKAAGRGIVNGVAEQTDTVLEMGQAIADKAGIYDGLTWLGEKTGIEALTYTEEERHAANPLGDWMREKRKEYLDVEESNIGYSMVEGIMQFTTGMVGLSKLKAGMAVKGAIADFSAFDPHEERLSNIVQDVLPENLRKYVWTAANEDDPAIVGRAKQALEGFLVGATVDKLVAGARVVIRRHKEAGKALEALKELADDTHKPGRWDVEVTEDGQHAVLNPAGEVVTTLPDRQTAESFASSSAVEERLNRVSLDGDLRGRIKSVAEKLAAEPEADLEHMLAELGDVNPIYADMTQEGKALTVAIAHEVRETMYGGRFAGKMDWDSVLEQTSAYMKTEGLDAMDPQQFLDAITDDTFERAAGHVRSVESATAAMQAYRIARAKATADLKFWGQKLDLAPNDPKAAENFSRALQAATDFHYYQATLGSRYGAGLNSRKIPVGAGGALRDVSVNPGEAAAKSHKRARFATVKNEADAADLRETMRSARELAEAAEDAKLSRADLDEMRKALNNQKGSAGVRASDFQKSRITKRIRRIQAALDRAGAPQPDVDLSELGIATRSAKVLDEAQGRTTRRGPAEGAGVPGAAPTGNPIESLSRWLDQAEDRLDAALAPKLERVSRGAKEESPVTKYVRETKNREAELARAGGKINAALEHNKRYLRHLDVEKTSAIAKELRELSESTMTLTQPEMRALARHLSVLTDEGELEFAYDALTAYFKKKGADELLEEPATTLRGHFAQTPSTSSFTALDGTATAKTINFLLGYRMNALLSGPKTQGTNVLSGIMNSLYLPLEKGVAGALGFNPEQRREAANLLVGLFHSYSDSWRLAKATFKTGRDSLDSFHGNRNLSLPEWAKSSWPLRLMQMPTRLLMTADEFFKQMSYRSSVRAQSLEASLKAGVDPAEAARRLEADMKAAFNNGIIDPTMNGAAVNPKALKYAREVTWTQPMDGAISKRVLQAVEAHPELRLFLPFVRIPMNIMRWQFERFPLLGLLAKKNFDALRPGSTLGKEARNEAMARQSMGLFFAGSAYMLAEAGLITGRGPSDPRLRQEWRDLGFRPYSVKIGNKWVEYRRLEPFASAFGLAADFRDIRGELDRDGEQDTFAAYAMAMANFTLNKTYMKGLSDMFDALGGGNGTAAHNALANLAGSFVPNFLNQTNPDDVMRETRTYLDEVMSRVPGFSETLEPRRNFFGEPVVKQVGWGQRAMNPLASSAMFKGGDTWLREIVELGTVIGKPETKRGDFDLTDRKFWKRKDGKNQSPYDRWMELTGDNETGAPTLKEALKSLVESPAWKNMPAGTEQNPGGERAQSVREIVSIYRDLAWLKVQEEYEGPGGVAMASVFAEAELKKGLDFGGTTSPIKGSYFK